MTSEQIGEKLQSIRTKKELSLKEVAGLLNIEASILSEMEKGERLFTKKIVERLAKIYECNSETLVVHFLNDKVLYEIGDDDLALKALHAAEDQIEYKAFLKTDRNQVINKLTNVLKEFKGIQKAWIYGSFARKDDKQKSDVDIALQTDNAFSYFDLADVQYKAEEAIIRSVDVGFIDSFKPYIWKNVEPDLILIYEKG